jgi:hypothetical protein
MKKWEVAWTEYVTNTCCVVIEAETKEEAILKWENGEYENYDRDESSNSFEPLDKRDVKEVKE